MKVLAIIPVRGGSKGIPKKNLQLVGGVSLLERTIQVALSSCLIEKVLVSTDDLEMQNIVNQKYKKVFLVNRPSELARDDTPTDPVVKHAIDSITELSGFAPDLILLLQATSPFRSVEDINRVIHLFQNDDSVNAAMTVSKVGDEHPARMYKKDIKGNLVSFMPEMSRLRRQDLPELYRRNGLIYAVRYSEFKRTGKIISDNAYGLNVPPEVAINIDSDFDLLLARALLAYKK